MGELNESVSGKLPRENVVHSQHYFGDSSLSAPALPTPSSSFFSKQVWNTERVAALG